MISHAGNTIEILIKLISNDDNRNGMRHLLLAILVVSLVGLITPNAFGENVPDWVKNTAGWWATDVISETEFVNAIEFLVNEEIIHVSDATSGKDSSGSVPSWIKNNAGWWADGQIDDQTFVNGIEFLIKEGIIQIKAEQSELQILLQKRENLIDFIWKEDGFPTHFPDSIEQGISDKNFDDLKNLERIDKLTVEMKHGVNSVAYLLYPKEQSHDDLIIYHNGHGQHLHDGKKQVRFFLDRGYTVLVFSMPLSGGNIEPVIMLDGKETKITSHNHLELLESDKFSPISYFVEPIAISLNFIDKNFDYTNYHMLGISGGGWTTVIYPAIDQRISHAMSVAGSIPIELRTLPRDYGDYEQRLPDLYRIANYYDLYVLASFGTDKKLAQVFDWNDKCCFAAKDIDTSYSHEIKNRLTDLGSGEFEIGFTYNPAGVHHISGKALISFYLDIQNEKNVQDYYDMEWRAQGKNWSGVVMSETMWDYRDLSNMDFTGSTVHNSNFSNSDFSNSNFFSTDIDSVNFKNTDITNSDFSYSGICNMEIEKTTIHNVDFTKSIIIFSDFSKSELKNTEFDMSSCYGCIFDQIDVSEIKISKNTYHPTNFGGSSFKNVDFRNWEHGIVDFSAKNVKKKGCTDDEGQSFFPGADLTGSNFSGVDLKDIIFTRGDITDVTNLTNVDFSFADLSYHDLSHTILVGANLSNSDLTEVNLTNANLEGAILDNAILTGANLKCINHTLCNS